MEGIREVGCKVNWTLDLLGRRADGFHELRSWFLRLRGGDRLAWTTREGRSALEVGGPDAAGVPTDDQNLVLRAEASWRAAGGRAPAIGWRLDKRLPVGSGLGAGSADAAAALRVLEQCAEQPLGRAACLEVAAALGSDIPFFLLDAAAVCLGGRGERVLARHDPDPFPVVLALPNLVVPTVEVYGRLQLPVWPAESAAGAPASSDPPAWPARPQPNQLESAACAAVPELADAGARLRPLADFQLSGSGAAWFAPARDARAAEELAERVRALDLRAEVLTVADAQEVDG